MGFKIEKSIIDGNVEKEGLYKDSEELESADAFIGNLPEDNEELFSARDIGIATVPNASTIDKEAARKMEEEYIKNDSLLSAKRIDDEFKDRANSMISKLDDLFR